MLRYKLRGVVAFLTFQTVLALQDGAEGKHKEDGLPDWVMVRYIQFTITHFLRNVLDCLNNLVPFPRLTTKRELKEKRRK